MTTFYLIRGLPGSGKSSLASVLEKASVLEHNVIRVEADDFFLDHEGNYNFDATKLKQAHEYCYSKASEYLKLEYDVIVSNTSTTEKEVKHYQELAEKNNATFVSIIVENRHGNTSVHNVPAEKIQQMKNRFSIKL